MIIVKFSLAGNILKKNQMINKKYSIIVGSYKLNYNKNIRELISLTFLLATNTVIKSMSVPL